MAKDPDEKTSVRLAFHCSVDVSASVTVCSTAFILQPLISTLIALKRFIDG